MMNKKKILIVEDEVMIAEDISEYIQEMGHHVIGIAYDSEMALDYVAIHQPDLILLDITIDGSKNGIEVAEIIKEKYALPFIYITSHSDSHTLEGVKKTMPYGFIVKPFSERDLFSAVEIAIFRYESEKKDEELSLEKVNQLSLRPLTPIEFEVLMSLVEGLKNQEIADKHFVSINTVKTHIKNIYSKLNVHNRASLVSKVS